MLGPEFETIAPNTKARKDPSTDTMSCLHVAAKAQETNDARSCRLVPSEEFSTLSILQVLNMSQPCRTQGLRSIVGSVAHIAHHMDIMRKRPGRRLEGFPNFPNAGQDCQMGSRLVQNTTRCSKHLGKKRRKIISAPRPKYSER